MGIEITSTYGTGTPGVPNSGAGGVTPPFVPPEAAALQLWLKADTEIYQDVAETTLADSDSDPVRRWNDQSGKNNDFQNVAGADGTRPIYHTPLSLVGGLRFSGGQRLQISSDLNLPGEDVPTTCIFVFKQNVDIQGTILAAASNASATPFYRWLHSSGGVGELKFSPRDDGSVIKELVSGQTGTVEYYVCSVLQSGTLVNFRVNGAASGAADQACDIGTITLHQAALGVLWRQAASYAEYAQMDLIELFMWTTLLSQSEYESVESYLAAKTGITLS
jgi:hypothetical protein